MMFSRIKYKPWIQSVPIMLALAVFTMRSSHVEAVKYSPATPTSSLLMSGLTPNYYLPCRNSGKRIYKDGTTKCQCTFEEKQRGSLCETTRVNLDNANDMIEVNLLEQIDSSMFSLDKLLDGQRAFHLQINFVSADFQSSGHLLTLTSNDVTKESASLEFIVTGKGLQTQVNIGMDKYTIGPFNISLTDNKWHKIDFFIGYDIEDGYLKAVLIIDRCSITKSKCQESVNLWRSHLDFGSYLYIGQNPLSKGLNKIIDFWSSTEILDSRRNCPSCESFCKDGVCGKYGECHNVWSNSSLFTCKCQDGYVPNEIVEPRNSLPVYENAMIARQPCVSESQSYMTKSGVFRWKSDRGIPISLSIRFRHFGENLNLITIGSWKYSLIIDKTSVSMKLGNESLKIRNLTILDGNWHHVKVTISQTNKINGIQSSYVYTDVSIDHLHANFYNSLLVKTSFHQDYPEIRLAFSTRPTCLTDFWIEYPDQEEYAQQYYPLKSLSQEEISKTLTKGCQSENYCHMNEGNPLGSSPSKCPEPDRVCSPVWGGYECICADGLVSLIQGSTKQEYCVPPECIPNPCMNDGICLRSINFTMKANNITFPYECQCPTWARGQHCENVWGKVAMSRNIEWPWWAVLLLLLFLLLLLVLLLCCLIYLLKCCTRRRKKEKILKKTAVEVEKFNEANCYSLESAGEKDYRGPIDFSLISTLKKNHGTQSERNNPSPIVINQYPTYLMGPRIDEDRELDLSNVDPEWISQIRQGDAYYTNMDNTLNYAFEGDFSHLSRTNSNISQMNIMYQRPDSPVKFKSFQYL